MGRRVKKTGICKICGHYGQLSYEHVPPESAFNDQRHFYQVEFERLVEMDDAFLDLSMKQIYEKGYSKKMQGGIGFYSLCVKCNNDTGSWYGHAFVDWAKQAMGILQKSKGMPTLYYPTFFYPLRTIKQIITMFFSASTEIFKEAEPALVKFVLSKEERFLPTRYRLFCYYNLAGSKRYIGYSMVSDFAVGAMTALSEITFPPFGFVLTFDSLPPDNRLVEITHFANYEYNTWTDHYQRFVTLPTYLPSIPGDYRTKEEVKKSIQEGKSVRDN